MRMEENRGKNVKCTYLNRLVPACGVDNGVLGWGTFNGGNPVLVGLQGLDTVTKSVPDLDGLVSGSRNELSDSTRDGDGHDITVVAVESGDTFTVRDLPQSQGLIPGTRKSVSSIWGQLTVLDNVGVTSQGLLGDTVLVFVSGQLPDDQGLVSGSRQQEVWVCWTGGKGGDPTVVAL